MEDDQVVAVKLHPVYQEEVQRLFADPGVALFEAGQWTWEVTLGADCNDFGPALDSLALLEPAVAQFRAFVASSLLASTPQYSRLCDALCVYLGGTQLTVGGRYQLATNLSFLGVCARQGQHLEAAAAYARAGIQLIEELPVRPLTANLYHNLGVALEESADFLAASEAFRKSANLSDQLGQSTEAAGDSNRAAANYFRSEADLGKTATTLQFQGKEQRRRGDLMGALKTYHLALQAVRRSGSADQEAGLISNIAAIYFYQREYEKAVALVRKALDELGRSLSPGVRAKLHIKLGNIYLALERWPEAQRELEAGYQAAIEADDEAEQASCLYGQAEMLLSLGQHQESYALFERVLTMRERLAEDLPIPEQRLLLANTLNQLGVLSFWLGRSSPAVDFHQRALRLRKEINDRRGIAESLHSLALIYESADARSRRALAYAALAVRSHERMRHGIGTSEEARVAYFDSVQSDYLDVVQLSARLGETALTFWALQLVHNRAFLDSLCRRNVPRPLTIPPPLYEKEQQIFGNMSAAESDEVRSNDAMVSLRRLYFEELSAHDRSYVRWRTGIPMRLGHLLSCLQGGHQPARYLELIEVVESDEKTAERRGQFCGFVVDQSSSWRAQAFCVDIDLSGEAGVPERFDQLWFYRTAVEHALAPVLELLLVSPGPVFVVPHGPLARLPWHALRFRGEPVIARVPIRYLPHAGLLETGRWRGCSFDSLAPGRVRAAVLADPTGDLEAARSEGAWVAERLRALALFGQQATRAAMIESLRSSEILHFAGHGFLDPGDPLGSGLVLADGVLTARELRGLWVRTRLVVLNACESGVHSVGLGAELQGFVRALLLAGVDLVLCTQWRIDDDVARDFAEFYYGEFAERSTNPVEAAWAAQKAILRQHGDHTELWSPFIVVG